MIRSTGKTSKVALLGLSSLLATACATGPVNKDDKQAAEKSKAYMDGVSLVMAGASGGTCALPTAAQKNALTSNDGPSKEWKDLLSKASACVGDKNYKTLEQVAETMARVDISWRPQRGDWWQRLASIYETSLKNNELALNTYKSMRSSIDKMDAKTRPTIDLNGKIKTLEDAVSAARQPATAGNPAGGKPQASAKDAEPVRSKK
ncbi:MAG: hypothetical protein EOP05_07455 [Proteobacteria bacterium]|nr:MAG: hypothetical protein EOP05_07455 [Pseudomonadota bacterium]